MTGPRGAPPLSPIEGGSRSIGPFTATAEIGVGRRTIALLGHRGDKNEPLVLRTLNEGIDPDAFEAEVRGARVFEGKDTSEVLHYGAGTVMFSPALIGESLATLLDAQ